MLNRRNIGRLSGSPTVDGNNQNTFYFRYDNSTPVSAVGPQTHMAINLNLEKPYIWDTVTINDIAYEFPLANGAPNTALVNDGSGNLSWGQAGGTGTVTSVDASGGGTGLTFSGGPIITSGTLVLGGVLGTTNGGTGLTVIGPAGYVLSVNGTATGLQWSAMPSGSVTQVSSSLSGISITNPTTTPDISGTLGVTSGGTGLTSLGSAGQVLTTNPGVTGMIWTTPATGTVTQVTTSLSGISIATDTTTPAISGTLGITSGGTGQVTANSAFNALAPTQAASSGKFLTTNGTDTSWATPPQATAAGSGGSVQFAGPSNEFSADGNLLFSTTFGEAELRLGDFNLGGLTGALRLSVGAGGQTVIRATSTGGLTTFNLPPDNGSNGQFLRTDGVGNTTWATASGSGTVTSVNGSGGTTGMTLTGGPITTSGTLTLVGTLNITNGGTGATTRQAAINALAGSVTSGQYLRGNGTNILMSAIQAADVPTLNQNTTGTAANVTGVVAIANGGTGQTTANDAFNALVPAQTGNAGKVLTTDGTNTSWSSTPTLTSSWGTFWSTDAVQSLPGAGLSGTVNFTNGDAASTNVTFAGSQITFSKTCVYNMQYSLQFVNADTQIHDAYVWFILNGSPISDSNSIFSIPNSHGGTHGKLIAAINIVASITSGDVIELAWWADDNVNVTIETLAPPVGAPAGMPASPGAIFTATQSA